MNRNEEYSRLLAELDNNPSALDYTVTRAKERAKKTRHIRRFFTIPAGCIAVFFAVFVVMVNVSMPVAMACGRIPLLRELAAAVAFSPSLSAAIKNGYVQPIELEQTENGITMRVENVIVDQKQINIFYSLQSDEYSEMKSTPDILDTDGQRLEGYVVLSHGEYNIENGELRQIIFDFYEDIPDSLIFECQIYDNSRYGLISTFSFVLNFDSCYTSKGDVVDLNQSIILDGQHLTVTNLEIYPTHIRLNLLDDENNTAWLQSLTFYLENEKGERFDVISNGITATGSEDSPFMASHRLESSFFSESNSLTLYITNVVWLDKDMEHIRIDLANGTAEKLPEGVKLEQSERSGSSWQLTFSGIKRKENSLYQLFNTTYYDESGAEYVYDSWSMTNYYDDKNEEVTGMLEFQFSLMDYPFDIVYLSPSFSRTVELTSPVEIKVR